MNTKRFNNQMLKKTMKIKNKNKMLITKMIKKMLKKKI